MAIKRIVETIVAGYLRRKDLLKHRKLLLSFSENYYWGKILPDKKPRVLLKPV